MSSETDICNLALSSLGDAANVVSISPPSGGAQAVQCARFYPMARDALLEMHPWGFATRRVSLALLSETPPTPWLYAYVVPGDALNLLGVYDPQAIDDYAAGLVQYGSATGYMGAMTSVYTPQPFQNEVDALGNQVIYTNQQNAVLRYSASVTDTTTFSPLFTVGLSKLLASMLAGPLIRGSEGRAVAMAMTKEFSAWFVKATESDSNQHNTKPTQSVGWIANR